VFQKLVSHNEAIGRLVDRGYAIAFDVGYLVVRDIPYVDAGLRLRWGAIVTKLVFIDQVRVTLDDHQVFFAGPEDAMPHGPEGKPIPNLGGGTTTLALSDACKDVVVKRTFSNKPQPVGAFKDLFEKIDSYATIICGPAIELHGVTPYTFRAVKEVVSDSIFKFHDTMTSRAEITELSAKFNDDVIALIGLGGTGGYLLDFLVKTPVREIRAFDVDAFYVHNAFRSPGRLDESELGKKKVEVYGARYENFRTGLSVEPKFINASSSEELDGVTFAFVSVDKGSSRAGILEALISRKIPFIDVGLGLHRRDGRLSGMLRTTYCSVERGSTIRSEGLIELQDDANDEYRVNIQTAELNALNASLAIIRFKQLRGFYFEESSLYHHLFDTSDLKSEGESDAKDD
jgi:hypothetical protein